jgi:hypothetical protein
MMGSFGATPDQITWIVTSYMISTIVVMPLTGFLSARFGRREVLLWSIFGFVVASALCGAAWSLESMVLFRLLQGGFGAVLIPLSTFDRLPQVGAEVKLLTHHHVTEREETLFGFGSADERDLFRLLIDRVSGIGPKMALAVSREQKAAGARVSPWSLRRQPCWWKNS